MLTGVGLQVKRGSIFDLLSSNGAGKTRIVKILTTQLKHDSGNFTVNCFDETGNKRSLILDIPLTISVLTIEIFLIINLIHSI